MTVDHHICAVRVGGDNRHDWDFPVHPEPWMREGLCGQVDADLWFPDRGRDIREARRICRDCPVVSECAAFALARTELVGVWGGMSERERRLARAGAPLPGTHPPAFYRQRAATIRAMAAAGQSIDAIAAAVDAPRDTVRTLLSRDRRRGRVAS